MKTVGELAKELRTLTGEARSRAVSELASDPRKSVQDLLRRIQREDEKLSGEQARVEGLRAYELSLAHGQIFCGIDEAGRGPLAGPVVAAAVIMPLDGPLILRVNDSKKVPETVREQLYDKILEHALSVGVGIVSAERIDEINILQATYEAMRQAVARLNPVPELLINDAVTIPGLAMRQLAVIKGDAKCYSIAAASIIAKVTRDRIMRDYEELYPGYDFARNKGYGSAEHIQAIREKGLSPIHRKSFTGHFT